MSPSDSWLRFRLGLGMAFRSTAACCGPTPAATPAARDSAHLTPDPCGASVVSAAVTDSGTRTLAGLVCRPSGPLARQAAKSCWALAVLLMAPPTARPELTGRSSAPLAGGTVASVERV
eukprot:scaffold7247_cov484-Prasinococcus_capsulatus_cf.AAC.6